MQEPNHFIPLFILIFLALVAPLLLSRLKRIRVPIVVGEILAGILVGKSGLNLVPSNEPVLIFLSEFGLVFLMFLAGMEIDFSSLGLVRTRGNAHRQMWNPLTLGGLIFALTLVLSTASGFALEHFSLVRNPWMMALILSTTSLGVVVPVLKETRLIGSRYGQTLLVAALIADFATMLLITILVTAISHGLSVELLLIGVLFVAFFLAYRFGLLINRIPGVRQTIEELSHATAQIKVRFAFAIMLIFVVLSQVVGTEIILGSFLAGTIVALMSTPADKDIGHQLETIGFGFLIPIFFIKVGVDFDLSVLFASPKALALVPLLLVIAAVVKLLPALLLRLNFSTREALAGGALLSSRLSLIIAASAIGARLNVISQEVNAAIILVAVLTVTFAPLVFTRLAPKEAESETQHPILVVGAGELGIETAEQLCGHQERVIVLDTDPELVERARKRGFQAVLANVAFNDAATRAYLEQARTLVCTHIDTDLSLAVCSVARLNYGIPHVVALVTSLSDLAKFEQLGVTTMNPALDQAALLVMLARNPATYSLLTRTDDNKEVTEMRVENPTIVGRALRQLELPGDVLVLALRRNGELLVPHGNTRLEQGDYLTLVGTLEWVAQAEVMMGSR